MQSLTQNPNKFQSKQQALDLFEKTRKEFLQNCRWIAVRIAQKHGGYVNIDQVREDVTTPKGIDPRVYGAVFNTSEFEKTGYTQTTRKTSHGRPIAVFYWKDYAVWKSRRAAESDYKAVQIRMV